MLRFEGLAFRRGSQAVLGPLSGQLRPASLTGVVGPNGSGKSTLLRLLYGYLQPSAGAVFLSDRALQDIPPSELAREMGACPQEAEPTLDFNVEQALALALGGRREALDQRLARLPFLQLERQLGKRLSELSGGEKQRVRLGRALLTEPPWLLLDEPANHLDLRTTWSLMNFLRRERAGGVVVALHDLSLAVRFCDRLLLLEEGRQVATGTVSEVLTEANLQQVFGLQARVMELEGRPRLVIKGVAP